MPSQLTESSQAASSTALDAFAELIRALAPEVCSVSFHDFAADTLLLSEDFLLPEDHQLVEECLAKDATGAYSIQYGAREGARYSLAMPIRDAHGEVNGAVRLSIDAGISEPRMQESLHQRLAPVLVCLAAEFERRRRMPSPAADPQQSLQIDHALDAERFELHLQPIRSLRGKSRSRHYEVLLRLKTQDGVLLEPGAFLSAAERRQLMPAIDRWVLRSILVWLMNHRSVWKKTPTTLALNLSPQALTDSDFIDYVEACLKKSGVPASLLCFEITERFAASSDSGAAKSMKRLEALGCSVALDDFGGNAPCYGYLRQVPAHYFKIDAALVLAAPNDRVARAVISSIVRMASDLGVETVAESVQTDLELQAIRDLGVHYAQGFWVGRPQSLIGYRFPVGEATPATTLDSATR